MWVSADQLFLHRCFLRIAGSQPALSPWAEGKWLLQRVSSAFPSLSWATAGLVPAGLPFLLSYPLQNQRGLPKQKPLCNEFPLLNSSICRGTDWCSLVQRQSWIGAGRSFSRRLWQGPWQQPILHYQNHARGQQPPPPLAKLPNTKPPHLHRQNVGVKYFCYFFPTRILWFPAFSFKIICSDGYMK